ncbi:MAG: MoaD/ThiS family protein [Cytophagales bacterium]|nr:MAG: MoaD/ThiS family protein [Cytophagales bacterium]
MNRHKIIAFGIIAEKIGKTEFYLENIATTQALKEKLYNQYPFLQTLTFSIAIDHEILQEELTLEENQEIALLPPFSGG